MNDVLIRLQDLRFAWPGNPDPIIDCIDFSINRGEHLFVRGPSGSGKSTLLNLLAAVLVPQSGNLTLMGHQLAEIGPSQRDRLRADHIGFVFQQFNLVPYLDMVENLLLPCRFSPRRTARAQTEFGNIEKAAFHLLDQLFVDDRLDPRTPVIKLSVGQQQRVAAARALIGQPEILIADEPTSSLDFDARSRFMGLLFDQAETAGSTLVFVSHDPELAERFDRVVDIDHFKSVKRL